MTITNETPLPTAKRDVVYRALSDGAVLFSVSEEVYYGLNRVGACLWEALPPITNTVEALCNHLHSMYPDVELDILRADVEEILVDLREFGLVAEATVAATH